jgi:methyl-accepting chemotaxis protein
MTEIKRKRWFKQYIVDRDIQLRVIAYGLMYMLVVVVITVAVMMLPLISEMDWAENPDIQYYAAQTFLMLVQRVLPAITLLFLIFALHLVIITHRICGPLVNFSHTFKRITVGDLRRKVFIRRGDYLKKECERINEMIDGFSRIVSHLMADHRNLTAALEDLILHVKDQKTKEKIEAALDIVRNDAQYVTQTLSVFKLSENDVLSESIPKPSTVSDDR